MLIPHQEIYVHQYSFFYIINHLITDNRAYISTMAN